MGSATPGKNLPWAHVAAATGFGRVCLVSGEMAYEMKGVGHDIVIWRAVMVFATPICLLALRIASALTQPDSRAAACTFAMRPDRP